MGTTAPSGLAAALFGSVRQRILALFFSQPDRELSTLEVIRLAQSGSGAAQRELARLARSNLLTVKRVGNQKRYHANRDSPIFQELHQLILKTVGLAGPLREALSSYEDHIAAAFVYGSVAKGVDTSTSDIDLMIVGDDLAYSEVYEALQETERRLGRTINPNLMSSREWSRKLKAKNSFVTRVNDQPKLLVVGSEDALRAAG